MSEAGSRLAEIRKKFQNNNSTFVPTPENQFGRIKKSREDQVKAVRIAKARAARYNMTLRSLALKATQDINKMQRTDMKAKKDAQTRAAKYNMTSRALPVSTVVSRKDQENLSKALAPNVSPSIAKDVLAAVAAKRHGEDIQATTALVRTKRTNNSRSQQQETREARKAQNSTKENTAQQPAAEQQQQDEGGERKERIEMTGVGVALASGDEKQLNKAILSNFLEANAPQLLPKVDSLLGQYEEKLQLLFDNLLKQYPDAPDAEVSGQQKADKEIADAVQETPEILQPESRAKPKPAAAPKLTPAVEDDFDEEDSMIITEEKIDTYEAPDPKTEEPGKPQIEEFDDEEDSLIIDDDKAYNEGYEQTIKAAETNPANAVASVERRKSTVRIDNELTKELQTTYNDKKSLISVASMDSIVQADTPTMLEGGYIVAAELEEAEKEEEPSRWAVQFQNKNYALKQKLLKQGLSKAQVEDLVDNLETNTSEML